MSEEEIKEEAVDPAANAGETADTSSKPEPQKEPEPQLSPKERRVIKRSADQGGSKAEKTLDQRIQEREAERLRKANSRRLARQKAKQQRSADKPKAATTNAVVNADEKFEQSTNLKLRQGVVVSDIRDKTITVRIDVARRHRRYQKIIRSSSKLHAHDEKNTAKVGDVVQIIECRPLSKTKRWRLVDILERGK